MPLTMKQIRDLPGETRELIGYLDEVVVLEPTDKDRERAAKGKYEAKTKYYLLFTPNKLEPRKVKFDPDEFPINKLKVLEAACISINCEVRSYEFTDEKTGEVRKGESADLTRLGTMYRDANGDEPKRPQ